ncbi:hypothetical protein L7F22_024666 [Adiantum nelumboides]|nr:hypothetical protein [Adiantum nelumboides]
MSQNTLLAFFERGQKASASNAKAAPKQSRRQFLEDIFGSDSEIEDSVEIEETIDKGVKSLNVQEVEDIEGTRQSGDSSHNGVSSTTQVTTSTKARKISNRKFRQEWVNKFPFVFQVIRNDKEFMKCAWCTKFKVKGPWGKGYGCKTIMKSAIRKHRKSKEHKWAATKHHNECGKQIKAHAKEVIGRNKHRVITVMKLAYFNAKEDLAIRNVRHADFQSLLKEMHLQVLEVLSIHDVRWLARGNVMERLTQLMPAILSFWKDKAKIWYEKLRENVDIPSISAEIEVALVSLKRKFLEQGFGKGTHFLKKFMDATKDRIFMYVTDDGKENSHYLLYAEIPGNDANGLPLDTEGGDVQSCIKFAKRFVLKVVECVNDRFPNIYFFNAAKLFSPQHYPCKTMIAEEIKAREKKFSKWLEKLLEKFENLVYIDACKAKLLSFTDTLYYGYERMSMSDAWRVLCSNEN